MSNYKLREKYCSKLQLDKREGIDKTELYTLSGITNDKICEFFNMLDTKEKAPDKLLKHTWGINGITSFHDWYCALARCLGDENKE